MRNIQLLVLGSCAILMHIHSGLFAQEKKKKNYSLDVQLLTEEHRNGILKAIDGSNLILKEKDSDSLFSIPASDIRLVKVKKVNAGGHILKGAGIVIGAASGLVLGYIIGYHSNDDCNGGTCPELAPEIRGVAQGLLGGIVGGALGSLLGNPAKKYDIDGLPENFEKMKMDVSK